MTYAGYIDKEKVTKVHSTKLAVEIEAIEKGYQVQSEYGKEFVPGFRISEITK